MKKDTINIRERIETVLIYGVFVCYTAFLVKLLLLSRVSLSDPLSGHGTMARSINPIPFYSIREYLFGGDADVKRFTFGNIVGNIAVFVPLGTYLALFKKDKRVMINLLPVFVVSLSVETIQGLLGIGVSDIDDIILNCLGGLIGVLGYNLLLLVLRDTKRVRTAIALVSAVGLPRLLFYLFVVRLRL